MFSGAISLRIKSEDHIIMVRDKAHEFAEKIGFNRYYAGIISTIISSVTRSILSTAKTGRIDILSIRNDGKTGLTIVASIEGMKREEVEKLLKSDFLNQVNLKLLTSGKVIDEFKLLPVENREAIIQITKWA